MTDHEKAILAIWREKINPGTAVYLRLPTITFLEGIIKKISFRKGYAILENVAGSTYIPLKDPQYIEVLCAKDNQVEKSKHSSCKDISCNIWSNIKIGDNVFLGLEGEPFVAKVVEINFKNRFVGLRTTSGITYLPFSNHQLVRVSS